MGERGHPRGRQTGNDSTDAAPIRWYRLSTAFVPATPAAVPKVGARPLFLLSGGAMSTPIQTEIEERLAEAEPSVEVLLAEVVPGGTCRLFIDHPGGVSLELCERVTNHLGAIRERYALEVSSPGRERPLTKPDHFRRFLGRRARVRTREQVEGHQSFTGELVGASDSDVTIAADTGVAQIPYADIQRSNLVEE
jgi:ribosome maturation factor RimP